MAMLHWMIYTPDAGANLAEASPIRASQSLLREDEEESELKQPRRLALIIKAFNMHIQGKLARKKGLFSRTMRNSCSSSPAGTRDKPLSRLT
jgi:hypothetical protein